VERGSGIYNIVDDDPTPVREMVPAIAELLGAKPPRRVPVWLARIRRDGVRHELEIEVAAG
jgi:nucleoside-diphosphate-sugar epimerase